MVYAWLHQGRVSIPGQIYLLSAVTRDREPFFRDFCNARVAVNELRRLHECGLVRSLAWVVMPDHLHWLMGLGHTHSISVVAKMMKARTAQAINRNMNRHGQVWQRAFHEHAVRAEEDIVGIARYIVANPLRAGIVKRVGDYSHWDAAWL